MYSTLDCHDIALNLHPLSTISKPLVHTTPISFPFKRQMIDFYGDFTEINSSEIIYPFFLFIHAWMALHTNRRFAPFSLGCHNGRHRLALSLSLSLCHGWTSGLSCLLCLGLTDQLIATNPFQVRRRTAPK